MVFSARTGKLKPSLRTITIASVPLLVPEDLQVLSGQSYERESVVRIAEIKQSYRQIKNELKVLFKEMNTLYLSVA